MNCLLPEWVRGLINAKTTLAAVLAIQVARVAHTQEAVTISGHVSASEGPLQGASVRIPALDVGGVTDQFGRYSFIVPSSRVRGQKATLTARHVRYTTLSVEVTLVGGPMVRDFTLPAAGRGVAAQSPGSNADRGSPIVAPVVSAVDRSVVDSSALGEAAGPIDLPTALAGKVAGLLVTNSGALGGSSSILIRGSRSLTGNTQPLYIVDGMVIDNSTFTTIAQRVGFGGFDYGSAVSDLNLGDISSVQVLSGPSAALLYGARAANGVILVTTKAGRGLNGFEVSASQQVTFDSPVRLPTYQNTYGQGLGGKFVFFDGAGGGVNDAVAESWGPAIQGQPIAQASLTESKRGDVRPWTAHPNNVIDYFDLGKTFTTNVAAQASNDRGTIRVSANNRSFSGLTPGSSIDRRGLATTAGYSLTSALEVSGNVQYSNDDGSHRPGTGFDESNPVSAFTGLGRQVDLALLRAHLVDSHAHPISWNYAGHNNPYFEPLLNTNDDDQSRIFGGLAANLVLSKSLVASARVGGDSYDAARAFTVAREWMGGYPFFTGRGDFAEGGRDHQLITVREKSAEAALHISPGGPASRLVFSVGGSWRGNSLTLADTVVADTATGVAGAPKVYTPSRFASDTRLRSVFASGQLRFSDRGSVSAAARNEWSSVFPSGHDSQLYPSVVGVLDLKRSMSSIRENRSIGGARLRAGISRAGNDPSAYVLQGIYSGTQTANNISLSSPAKVVASNTLEPETTNAFELGADAQFFSNRLGLDFAFYNENTSNLIVASVSQSIATPTNAGSVSNKGVEATIAITPISGAGLRWDAEATFAHNSSSVGALLGGAQAVALAPTRWGVGIEARKGQPLAAIVGNGYLRDKSGELILSKGRPLADTISGRKILGTSAPSWTGGLTNSVHVGWFDVSALLTARMGGKIFSASNMWGATSGSYDETTFRPDTGLLIRGLDAATGAANTVHVTTEDYYHALRAIPERWIYDAGVIKLREARISTSFPMRAVPGFQAQSLKVSFVGRNLFMWAKAPNIDPETTLSTWGIDGLELGQLPTTRSVGFQVTITP